MVNKQIVIGKQVKVAPVPDNERTRLQSLRALNVLDTPPEERFDRVTRLARRLFDVPIVLVSLVDANRQWFKSRQGLDAEETRRDIAFCSHTILGDDTLVVEDASGDERFSGNPLVTADPQIRFYAGHPLSSVDGSKIGTLCLIDRQPRTMTTHDLVLLRDLASMVEGEFGALKLATTDPLTGLSNRRAFEALSRHTLAVCERVNRPCSAVYIDLDEFKKINDRFGHAEGDRALVDFAHLLLGTFRESDVIGRLGGDEFCVLVTDGDQQGIAVALARLDEGVRIRNADPKHRCKLSYSVGICTWDPLRHSSIAELLRDADANMYVSKRAK